MPKTPRFSSQILSKTFLGSPKVTKETTNKNQIRGLSGSDTFSGHSRIAMHSSLPWENRELVGWRGLLLVIPLLHEDPHPSVLLGSDMALSSHGPTDERWPGQRVSS